MGKFSLYIDEDAMDTDLVRALRQRQVHVMTAIEEKMAGRADEEQLQFAFKHGCVLYTFNVADFFDLHTHWLAKGKPHAGLILASQQRYSIWRATAANFATQRG